MNEGEASLVVPEGPESIVVFGGVRSTVHVRETGLGSGFPAASTALTSDRVGALGEVRV